MREFRGIARALVGWFAREARDLPWRRTIDPYAIWISEVMLQQTQVKTVIPYWERWLREFPDVARLAAARPEKVLKLWEGLGYYTRARNLHRAAKEIVRERRGEFPTACEEILALPGIGRYTAGAIASIGFNQPAPILDGNVIRVLARVFAVRGNPRERPTHARLWELAERLVVAAREIPLPPLPTHLRLVSGPCSVLNQALMELGATVCRPRQPDCPACPLARRCVAHREGAIDDLPVRGTRPQSMTKHSVAFIVERRGRFLVRQRPTGVVNAHLWEFPNVELHPASQTPTTAAQKLGFRLLSSDPIGVVNHTITHHRIRLSAYRALRINVHGKAPADGRWCLWREMETLAFAGAHRRILRDLLTSDD